MILAVNTSWGEQPTPDRPTGDELVSSIDDLFREDRQWIKDCFSKISGYPYNTYLIIPKWASHPSSNLKEGFMGFNTTAKKLEYYNGSTWEFLEYAADTSATCTGNSATATRASQDADGNTISSAYLKTNQVQVPTGESTHTGRVARFTSSGRLQFPNGAEFWVT